VAYERRIKIKKVLKIFKHKGEEYEIVLEKRPDGIYIVKDFNSDSPFSPFFHCVPDLGFIDIDEINVGRDQPILQHLISQSEEGARYWADNKQLILGSLLN